MTQQEGRPEDPRKNRKLGCLLILIFGVAPLLAMIVLDEPSTMNIDQIGHFSTTKPTE